MSAASDPRADLAEDLVPVAARLVGAVHDDGPDVVATLLRGIPAGHLPALAVVLAAMVDPERTPRELLYWLEPPPSTAPGREHGTDRGYYQHTDAGEVACPPCCRAHADARAPRRCPTQAVA